MSVDTSSERIWVGRWAHGGRAWRETASPPHIATEYVRADLHTALLAEREAARAEGYRQGQEDMRKRAADLARQEAAGARELKDALPKDDVAGRLVHREAEVTAILLSEQIRELCIQQTAEKESE